MSDLDRLLRDALQGGGRDYRPTDLAGARHTFIRRRRRMQIMRFATAGVVVAAAVVGALVFTGDRTTLVDDKPPIPPVDSPDLATLEGTIEVGDGPSGIAAGAGYIWVANHDDGTVSQIDPATHDEERFQVGGAPEDLVVSGDRVWISHRELGGWTGLNARTGEPIGEDVMGGLKASSATHVDLDVLEFGCSQDVAACYLDGDVVLYATGDRETDASMGDLAGTLSASDLVADLGVGPISDVSAVGDDFWVVSPQDGTVSFIEFRERPNLNSSFGIGSFVRGDLVANGVHAWVAQSDKQRIVHVVESLSGTACTQSSSPEKDGCVTTEPPNPEELRVDGSQFGLAYGEDSLWVVSTEGPEGPGALMRVDPYAMQVLHTVPIEGNPVDLVVDEGSVWVVDALNDVVLRFEADEFVPAPEEAPVETGSPDPNSFDVPVETSSPDPSADEPMSNVEDVVFFHSTGGDIYAEFADGSSGLILNGPGLVRPAYTPYSPGRVPHGGLLFERDTEMAYFDFKSIEETKIGASGQKSHAAVSASGEEAWIQEWAGEEDQIVIGGLFSEPSSSIHLAAETGEPYAVAWDARRADLLYYATQVDELTHVLYSAFLPEGKGRFEEHRLSPRVEEDEALLVAPSSQEEGSVEVLRLCCRTTEEDDFETLELVSLNATGQGDYQTIIDLSGTEMHEHLIGPTGDTEVPWERIFTAPAGTLDVLHTAERREWVQGDTRAWFVGDGEGLWLIDESGDMELVADPMADGGLTLGPALLSP